MYRRKGSCSAGPLEIVNLDHWTDPVPYTRLWKNIQFPELYVRKNTGRWAMSRITAMLIVTRYRQTHLDLTFKFGCFRYLQGSRDNAVGISTGYRPMGRSSSPGRGKFVSSPRPTNLVSNGYRGLFLRR
jgi:hypothetical protein